MKSTAHHQLKIGALLLRSVILNLRLNDQRIRLNDQRKSHSAPAISITVAAKVRGQEVKTTAKHQSGVVIDVNVE